MICFRIYYRLSGVIEKRSRMATVQTSSFDDAIEVFGKKVGCEVNIIAVFRG